MSKTHVTTTINGEPAEFLAEAGLTLLDALRDEVGLTGTKEGCGSGDCGACSVIVDGRLVCACLVLAVEAEGRTATHCTRCSANSLNMRPCNAASVLQAFWWQPSRCSKKTIIRRKLKSASGWPAIFAAALGTTKLSAP
jgi:aerobic-type carbon monoxide dehydrogenase small subunit (CoxS/CutS family)